MVAPQQAALTAPRSSRSVSVRSMDPTAAASCWWEKDLPENFKHIDTVQELVDELSAAPKADQLCVVDFFAPWCRACKALFPKFCRLCRENPDVRFLAINFDENKGLARGLGVKVLPFFHFYRGAEGRVDAFTASISKIAKLKDAVADYKSERCFLEEDPEFPLPEFPSVLPGGKIGVPAGANAATVPSSSAKTELVA